MFRLFRHGKASQDVHFLSKKKMRRLLGKNVVKLDMEIFDVSPYQSVGIARSPLETFTLGHPFSILNFILTMIYRRHRVKKN